ncbi:hypothetical protein [Nitratireductor basaltis]|uniref:Uncharacterized protein n=1 Tax=Nitratireductor basaltis TaxID=472175 RepID=A0A084U866_9HYPH|nr:hypothetical protein [Nitratireductor basaltis]KFB09152.1 hypothetical protein EL18_00167 [Nitratireductor basaltis]
MKDNRDAIIAAAFIIIGFGVIGYFMPRLVLAVGEFSTLAAGAIALLFVLGFFLIFWLRGIYQRRKNR